MDRASTPIRRGGGTGRMVNRAECRGLRHDRAIRTAFDYWPLAAIVGCIGCWYALEQSPGSPASLWLVGAAAMCLGSLLLLYASPLLRSAVRLEPVLRLCIGLALVVALVLLAVAAEKFLPISGNYTQEDPTIASSDFRIGFDSKTDAFRWPDASARSTASADRRQDPQRDSFPAYSSAPERHAFEFAYGSPFIQEYGSDDTGGRVWFEETVEARAPKRITGFKFLPLIMVSLTQPPGDITVRHGRRPPRRSLPTWQPWKLDQRAARRQWKNSQRRLIPNKAPQRRNDCNGG